MIEILPGILAHDATELREKLFFPGFWEPGMTAHVDILDGSMFDAACFCDATAIAPSSDALFKDGRGITPRVELHCMVQNPMPVIEQWKSLVPETIRAIVHAEISRPVAPILDCIRDLGLETGVAICPETSPDFLSLLPSLPNRLLIMGVNPGASGRPFIGEPILAKIRRARTMYPSVTIAIDGGMTAETSASALVAGANAFIATSAIWSAKRPHDAYQHLAHSSTLPGARNI